MNKNIVMAVYNRPQYLDQTLSYLSNCYSIDEYTVSIFVDPSDRFSLISNTINKYSKKLDIKAYLNPRRLGCGGNVYQALFHGFENLKSDFVIMLEDDLIAAKDALLYFEQCNILYKDNNDIFTISAFNNGDRHKWNYDRDYKPENLHLVYRDKWFSPWLWGTWQRCWQEMKINWQFNNGPRFDVNNNVIFQGGVWDCYVNQVLRKDRFRILPEASRVKNIGREEGQHCDPLTYDKGHVFKYWANSFLDKLGQDKLFYESDHEPLYKTSNGVNLMR